MLSSVFSMALFFRAWIVLLAVGNVEVIAASTGAADTTTAAPPDPVENEVAPPTTITGSGEVPVTVSAFTFSIKADNEVLVLPDFKSGSEVYDTASLIGSTTLITQVSLADYQQTVPEQTQSLPGTFVFTTTVTSKGLLVLDEPDGSSDKLVTIYGPTTYVATLSHAGLGGTTVYTEPGPSVFTVTETLDIGSQVYNIPIGNTSTTTAITGPTTWIATLTADANMPAEVNAAQITTGSHCSATAQITQAGHYVTYAELFTIIPDHTTITATLIVGIMAQGIGGNYSFSPTVITGPTTVFTTTTTLLGPAIEPDMYEGGGVPAGQVCGGACGFCNLYFPTVYVYYWPPADANTACLGGTHTAAVSDMGNSSIQVKSRREVNGTNGPISSLVSDGFTFISPSAYIAFPTISAFDECGILGQIHTSTTVAFGPDELSTLVINKSGTSSYSFNFADAQCPPASLSGMNAISFIGQTGYNPIISPPKKLTLIDPAWNANCLAAPFQGNDPPFALQPAANGDPGITAGNPVIPSSPATAGPNVPALPASTTMFSPSSPTPQPPSDPGLPAPADPSPSPATNPAPVDPGSHPAPGPVDPAAPPPAPAVNPAPADPGSVPAVNPPPADPGSAAGAPAPPVGNPQAPPAAPADPKSQPPAQDPNAAQPYHLIPPAQNPPAVISIGGQSITADSSSNFVVGSQTIVPGAAPVTINEIPVSIAAPSSFVVVGGNTQKLDPLRPAGAPAVLTIGGEPVTADSSSHFVIGSQTLAPGGVITVSGTPISIGSSSGFAVIGSNTQAIAGAPAPTAPPAVLTFNGQSVTANSNSQFVVGAQTLTPGGPAIIVSGTRLSVGPSGSVAVVGFSTQTLITPSPGVIPFAGASITENSASQFIIGGQTLTPGGVITVSGTPISLPTSGSSVVIGSSTLALGTAAPGPQAFTFDGGTFVANSQSDYIIDGQTLTPGGAITVSGTPISLPYQGSFVIEGSQTIPLQTALPGPEPITFDGSTFTADSMSDYVIDGQTLTPGGVITVDGTPISLAADPTDVVVGTSTQDLGGLIMSGLGSGQTGTPFTGSAPLSKDYSLGRLTVFAAVAILGSVIWVL